MNLLVDTLPSSVVIDGQEYPINTDYRACLRTIMAFEPESKLTGYEMLRVLLHNMYPAETPGDIRAAIDKAMWFLDGGQEREEETHRQRVSSFQKDASLIFSAFRQTHGIDMQTENLHWWSFLALFMDLGQDTAFCHLVGLRKRHAEGKTSKEENAVIESMGDLFYIEQVDAWSIEQREALRRFDEEVEAAQRKRNG